MRPRHTLALTWREVLVAFGILTVLGLLANSAISRWLVVNQMTSTFSNMKQLHLATESMAKDGETTGDRTLGWPGDVGGTYTNWAKSLVPDYLGTNDFCKLLSAPGKFVPSGVIPRSLAESAILVYAVSTNSPENAVFLSTANFTNGSNGGQPLLKTAKPYGNAGFVVLRKRGDGTILRPRQVSDTNVIGSYVSLLR